MADTYDEANQKLNDAIRKKYNSRRGVDVSHVSSSSLNEWLRGKKTDAEITEEGEKNAKKGPRLTQAQLLRIVEIMSDGETDYKAATKQALAESKESNAMNNIIRAAYRGEPIETDDEDK